MSTAAVLLFGKEPQKFFPRARVRFIRYEGAEEKFGVEMNVIKDVIFKGTILKMIRDTIAYLDTQIKEKTYLGTEGIFVTEEEYPKFVRQEIIVNEVTHRAYSITGTDIQVKMFDNRIVVESPGKLPGMVKADNIRFTHFSRNPKIAEFLKAYDYVKEYGEGVDRMCRELSALGVREPQYNLVAFIMKATVCANVLDEGKETTQKNYPETAQKLPKSLSVEITPIQRSIVEYIIQNPYAGRVEIASQLGNITEDGVKYNLKVLQQKGILKRVGPAKGGHWKIITLEE